MDMLAYQKWTMDTAVYPRKNPQEAQFYVLAGLTSEVGEVASVMKRRLRDGTPEGEFIDNMKKELGDVLWYLARLSDELGLDLSDIARANKDKLLKRQASSTLHGKGDNR